VQDVRDEHKRKRADRGLFTAASLEGTLSVAITRPEIPVQGNPNLLSPPAVPPRTTSANALGLTPQASRGIPTLQMPPLKILEDLKRLNTSDGPTDGVPKEGKGTRKPKKKKTYENLRAGDEEYRNRSSHEKMLADVLSPTPRKADV
jgi:hypothetical protein